jgi:hypothetical protein
MIFIIGGLGMKKLFLYVLLIFFVCILAGNAWAGTVDFRWANPEAFDLDFNLDSLWVKVSPGKPFVSYNKHDLKTHADFNPASQKITSATLDLYMRDTVLLDQDDPLYYPFTDFETAVLFVNGIQCAERYEVNNDTTPPYEFLGWSKYTYVLTPAMIAKLVENNYVLDFTLTADPTQGDFLFKRSVLKVTTAPVPLPSSLILIGTGLLGLNGIRRRVNG